MFPLFTTTLPSSAADLERLLNESLRRVFVTVSDPVTVREHAYPHLDAISISLDGAQLDADPPRPAAIDGEAATAFEVDRLVLGASPLLLGPLVVDLSLSAREVRLGQGRDSSGQIVLSLERATEGVLNISATQKGLEDLITRLAQDRAGKQGFTIEGVQLKLRQESERSTAAEVHLRARRLFLSASVRVTGQLDLDDQLNLQIAGLKCTGDGAIATLACGILTPYLQKLDGREFPLMSLPLGKVRLRDVRLTVGDKVCVTAEFGSAT